MTISANLLELDQKLGSIKVPLTPKQWKEIKKMENWNTENKMNKEVNE